MPLFEAARDDFGLARVWRLRSEVGLTRLPLRRGSRRARAGARPRHRRRRGARGDRDQDLARHRRSCTAMPVGVAISRCREMLEHARGVRLRIGELKSSACSPTCLRWPTILSRGLDPSYAAHPRAIFEETRNQLRARRARPDSRRSGADGGGSRGGETCSSSLWSRLPREDRRERTALHDQRPGSRTSSTSRGVTTMQTGSHGRARAPRLLTYLLSKCSGVPRSQRGARAAEREIRARTASPSRLSRWRQRLTSCVCTAAHCSISRTCAPC